MGFDNLFEIDITNSKVMNDEDTFQFGVSGINVRVREYAKHTGSTFVNVSGINIFSAISNETVAYKETIWDINESSIVVKYEQWDGADYLANITIDMNGTQDLAYNLSVDPASGVIGYVNVSIENLALTNVGHNMSYNDRLWLEYYIISPSTTASGDIWNFPGNTSLTTEGGTPTREESNATLSAAAKKLIAYKTIRAVSTAMPNNLTVTVVLNVTDDSEAQSGIAGIKFIDYLPEGTDFVLATRPYIRFYNSSQTTWFDWTQTVQYNITNLGLTTLPDGSIVTAYEYNNTDVDGWTLLNDDVLWLNYTFNVSNEGLYTLPTIFAAFDPDTGEEIRATAFDAIVVTLPAASIPLSISERDLELSQFITVEKPVMWEKRFTVYNPNIKSVAGDFKTEIFKDTMKVDIRYFDELGNAHNEEVKYEIIDGKRYVLWSSTLNALENRIYTITALTPPVIETHKGIFGDVEELDDGTVRITLDISLRNTAEEDYENVRLHLRTSYDKIESVKERDEDITYWGSGEETTIVEIEKFPRETLKTIRVVYVGSYPILIVTTNKNEYETGFPVGMTILVINGGEDVENPYFLTEVYDPKGNIVRSVYTEGESMEKLQKGEITQEFTIPKGSITGLYAANVRFREDYAILATGGTNFQIHGVSETFQTLAYILLIASTLVVLSFSYQRVKRIQTGSKRFKV